MKPLYLHLGLVTVLVTILSAGFGLSFFHSSDNSYVNTAGTVRFLTFEGGFFGIIGDDGERYDPLNLGDEFKVDGLRVEFEASICSDCASFHMWGWIVRIHTMEVEFVR